MLLRKKKNLAFAIIRVVLVVADHEQLCENSAYADSVFENSRMSVNYQGSRNPLGKSVMRDLRYMIKDLRIKLIRGGSADFFVRGLNNSVR
jgi:hypothetical protein